MTREDESRFYGRVFWLTAAALLALALLSILKPFFESILWAGLLAFLLAPVTRRLTRAFRLRRTDVPYRPAIGTAPVRAMYEATVPLPAGAGLLIGPSS